ncbi:MAG: TCP-1/cpn60 chaperonin family protein, partial [Candidatus Bathyarchaeia archaeon]
MFPMPHRSLPSLITKEGTKRTEGHKALRNNVSVAGILADVVKPTLGPNGLDKAVVRDSGEVIVTNDCATIFAELQMKHSA